MTRKRSNAFGDEADLEQQEQKKTKTSDENIIIVVEDFNNLGLTSSDNNTPPNHTSSMPTYNPTSHIPIEINGEHYYSSLLLRAEYTSNNDK